METAKPSADAAGADSKTRFSSRVENYVKYRPNYPVGVMDILREHAGLRPGWVVGDVGSGTGISCELFLEAGHEVYAVEPNADMRAAAERQHGAKPSFHSVAASAERTGLPDRSVDLVYCAQAFHWLDHAMAATEFKRILRPGGAVAIVWNERKIAGTAFLDAYESFLRTYGTDYDKVVSRTTTSKHLAGVFAFPFERYTVPNRQTFDYDGLFGRAMSASYVPLPDSPVYPAMCTSLRRLFDEYQVNGTVDFDYTTEIFVGKMTD